MTTNINRVLFDYDGTLLVHDRVNQGKQIAEILKIPDEKKEKFIASINTFFANGLGRKYYANQKITYDLYCFCVNNMIGNLKEFGITIKQLDDAITINTQLTSKLAPNTHETLSYLQDKGYTLCIFTNGFYNAQANSMKYHGVYDYFERIYAWDNNYAKPDKRAFKRALAGTNPINNMMVGDSITSDIAPAKEMGIYTVGINIVDQKASLITPDTTITNLSELKTIL